ncbi:MAG TPA: LysR family transcriptional regulator [Bacteroidales bacterium]|nr:LysR family transcriptional regulator [Bacteroidales bacterium]
MAGPAGSKYYDIFLRHQVEMISGENIIINEEGFRFLMAIGRLNSIASAADEMKISYRKAWGMIRDIEMNLGMKLVGKRRGGSAGGHTTLTGEGLSLVNAYNSLLTELETSDREIIRKFFRSINQINENL